MNEQTMFLCGVERKTKYSPDHESIAILFYMCAFNCLDIADIADSRASANVWCDV